jgi:hypothetical protein
MAAAKVGSGGGGGRFGLAYFDDAHDSTVMSTKRCMQPSPT